MRAIRPTQPVVKPRSLRSTHRHSLPPWCRIIALLCLLLLGQPPYIGTLPALAQAHVTAPLPERISADLHRILAQPEFREHPGRNERLNTATQQLDRIGRGVRRAWNRLWQMLMRLFQIHGAQSERVSVALVAGLLIAITMLLTWVCARVLRRRLAGRPRELSATPRTPRQVATSVSPPTPEALLTQARNLASNGDYRGAIRATFLAMIFRMDAAGSIQWKPSRTNGDYLQMLEVRPASTARSVTSTPCDAPEPAVGHNGDGSDSDQRLFDEFAWAATRFDCCWYGGNPATESDYIHLMAAYGRINDLVVGASPLRPGYERGALESIGQ